MAKRLFLFLIFLLACDFTMYAQTREVISVEQFGVYPNTKINYGKNFEEMLHVLQNKKEKKHVTIRFPKGRYDFYEDQGFLRNYYISNHDQTNPRHVGLALENLNNVEIDGQGSEFIFHGRMIPFSILGSKHIKLKNFSVDFEVPALRQIKITSIDKDKNLAVAEIYPKGYYTIENDQLIILGETYQLRPEVAMVFEADKRLAYKRRDVGFNPKKVEELAPDVLQISGWDQIAASKLGEVFVLRGYDRPAPGIFVDNTQNLELHQVSIHYAEGMGLVAQMSENILLDGFKVALKGKDDPRFFTTQADATHFSGCKGKIISKNGVYEAMADDAINVHGTYLKIVKRINSNTVQARYMHNQTWGFSWGEVGDEVQFLESGKMENIGKKLKIAKIKAVDQPDDVGAKIFEISFTKKIPEIISEKGKFAVENLTWTPELVFEHNVIRNNRARGALFSTPKKVICSNNTFDHTHGTAILLAGDANGWYETGACKNVLIKGNRFINALTAHYQFTNAIISIYPEIPDLKGQTELFHSGIVIEDNVFETFDRPILYAKSVNGLIFKNNKIVHNTDYPPFHWNDYPFFFEKVKNIRIFDNHFDQGFQPEKDVLVKESEKDAVVYQ